MKETGSQTLRNPAYREIRPFFSMRRRFPEVSCKPRMRLRHPHQSALMCRGAGRFRKCTGFLRSADVSIVVSDGPLMNAPLRENTGWQEKVPSADGRVKTDRLPGFNPPRSAEVFASCILQMAVIPGQRQSGCKIQFRFWRRKAYCMSVCCLSELTNSPLSGIMNCMNMALFTNRRMRGV